MLTGFLRYQRATLERKCAGLSVEAMARRAAAPSDLSLLGLVRHLAEVECGWFRVVLAGGDTTFVFATDDDPDADIHGAAPDPALVAEAWAAWRAEVAVAERVVEDRALDDVGQHRWRGTVSVRWVLLHMIEEYARHNGHADLLRERIDGTVGL
jgi:uncharacterized damage-inducible protein DinB